MIKEKNEHLEVTQRKAKKRKKIPKHPNKPTGDSPTDRRSRLVQKEIGRLRSNTIPKNEGLKTPELEVWRGRMEDLSSIGSTKPDSNHNTDKLALMKNSKPPCPVW